jgi:hypothetical protein
MTELSTAGIAGADNCSRLQKYALNAPPQPSPPGAALVGNGGNGLGDGCDGVD